MALVARGLQRIMQRTHHLRGRYIGGVLIPENPAFLPDDETESLDMVGQISQREPQRHLRIDIEIIKLEGLEIRQQNIARQLVILQRRKVIKRLLSGSAQVKPRRFLLDQQLALPEQVEIAALLVGKIDAMLEAGHALARHAKHLEKCIVKRLAFAALIMGVLPLISKMCGPRLDVVPVQPHCHPCSDSTQQWREADTKGKIRVEREQ